MIEHFTKLIRGDTDNDNAWSHFINKHSKNPSLSIYIDVELIYIYIYIPIFVVSVLPYKFCEMFNQELSLTSIS